MESQTLCQIFSLPEEIITNILSRLSVKSLLRFKSVCQLWRSLISSKHFIRTHLETSEKNPTFAHHRILSITMENYNYKAQHCPLHSLFFEPVTYAGHFGIPVDEPIDSLNLVGSCNGLVCIHMNRDNFIFWNPSTKKSKKLPDFDVKVSRRYITRDGFGFDKSTGDYKVYAVSYSQHEVRAKTYSLKSNSWRINDFQDCSLFSKTGKFVSGKLHWMIRKKEVLDGRWYISTFDLKNEVYGMVEQPEFFDLDSSPILGNLDGCLSVFYHYPDHQCRDLWVLKQYGVEDSWTKLFTFHDHLYYPHAMGLLTRVYVVSQSHIGNVLFKYGTNLFIYEPKNDFIWCPRRIGFDILSDIDVYVESLVSVDQVDDEE